MKAAALSELKEKEGVDGTFRSEEKSHLNLPPLRLRNPASAGENPAQAERELGRTIRGDACHWSRCRKHRGDSAPSQTSPATARKKKWNEVQFYSQRIKDGPSIKTRREREGGGVCLFQR